MNESGFYERLDGFWFLVFGFVGWKETKARNKRVADHVQELAQVEAHDGILAPRSCWRLFGVNLSVQNAKNLRIRNNYGLKWHTWTISDPYVLVCWLVLVVLLVVGLLST
jgi:hypothetical protein